MQSTKERTRDNTYLDLIAPKRISKDAKKEGAEITRKRNLKELELELSKPLILQRQAAFRPINPVENILAIANLLNRFPQIKTTAAVNKIECFADLPRLLENRTFDLELEKLHQLTDDDLSLFWDTLEDIFENHELEKSAHNLLIDLQETIEFCLDNYDEPFKAFAVRIDV